jgi:hypothetical protein
MQVRCCFMQQVSLCDAVPAHLTRACQFADTATALIRCRHLFEDKWTRVWERYFDPVEERFLNPLENSALADIVTDNSAKLSLVRETGWKPENVAREILSLRKVLRDQTHTIRWSDQYRDEEVPLWEDMPTPAQHSALMCICWHFDLPYKFVPYEEYYDSEYDEEWKT